MKAVILAGGYGTRISEESTIKPKPMVEIGGKPILWHIMKIYSAHGIDDFVICCGYKGHMIKEYFANFYMHTCDVTFNMKNGETEVLRRNGEAWKVTVIDTGEQTMTGGRLKRVGEYIGKEPFCCTYGDGLSDVNIRAQVEFHRREKSLATLTAVQPPGRFGAFSIGHSQNKITTFEEKPEGDGAWVNGGFFVLEPGVLDYIDGDATIWEREPMEALAHDGQLSAYKHHGFWQPMDTLRDKHVLEDLWHNDTAPWRCW